MNVFSEVELAAAAELAGVGIAHIAAVASVESTTLGPFDASGHPTVLFERHKFSTYTGGRYDLAHPDLSNPVSGGYGRYSAQVYRLRRARELDDQAAVMATSWGAFQIMGFNFRPAGFDSVGAFEAAMRTSAGEHLKAFVRFLVANNLAAPLVTEDWRTFARRYNGAAYERNAYHEKLAAAFAAAKMMME